MGAVSNMPEIQDKIQQHYFEIWNELYIKKFVDEQNSATTGASTSNESLKRRLLECWHARLSKHEGADPSKIADYLSGLQNDNPIEEIYWTVAWVEGNEKAEQYFRERFVKGLCEQAKCYVACCRAKESGLRGGLSLTNKDLEFDPRLGNLPDWLKGFRNYVTEDRINLGRKIYNFNGTTGPIQKWLLTTLGSFLVPNCILTENRREKNDPHVEPRNKHEFRFSEINDGDNDRTFFEAIGSKRSPDKLSEPERSELLNVILPRLRETLKNVVNSDERRKSLGMLCDYCSGRSYIDIGKERGISNRVASNKCNALAKNLEKAINKDPVLKENQNLLLTEFKSEACNELRSLCIALEIRQTFGKND